MVTDLQYAQKYDYLLFKSLKVWGLQTKCIEWGSLKCAIRWVPSLGSWPERQYQAVLLVRLNAALLSGWCP